MEPIIPAQPGRDGQAADLDPDSVTLADLWRIIADIRATLGRIEGYLDGVAATSPAFRLGRARGRRHARHGAR